MMDDFRKSEPGRPDQALDALFWRDEILQVMFWLNGEGLAEVVTAQELETFLDAPAKSLYFYLEQFTAEGYLVVHPDPAGMPEGTRYSLSQLGRKEGGRRFQDEFAEMQKSGHGECNADCSCHQTGDRSNCPTHGHRH